MTRSTELRNIIARSEAALEFLPLGAPIPYDIGTTGMRFEAEPVAKRDFTTEPIEVGERIRITGCGHSGKQVYRVIKVGTDKYFSHLLIDESEIERGVMPEYYTLCSFPQGSFEIFEEKRCITWYGKEKENN